MDGLEEDDDELKAFWEKMRWKNEKEIGFN
jgi:hypothetical protein